MYTFHIVSIFVVNDDLFSLFMVTVGHCHHIISMVYRDHQIIIFGWFFKVVFKLYCLCHSEIRGCRGGDPSGAGTACPSGGHEDMSSPPA